MGNPSCIYEEEGWMTLLWTIVSIKECAWPAPTEKKKRGDTSSECGCRQLIGREHDKESLDGDGGSGLRRLRLAANDRLR